MAVESDWRLPANLAVREDRDGRIRDRSIHSRWTLRDKGDD